MSDLLVRTSTPAEPFSAMTFRQMGVAAAIERLFAAPSIRAGVATVGEVDFDELPYELRRLISPEAVAHRKAGFASGRLAAARALQRMDRLPAWPGRTPTGAPAWPAGRLGSISHTDDVAAAVVSDPLVGSLGVDIEERRRSSRVAALARRICEPEEIGDAEDDEHALLRVFCAKEAVYKSLAPQEQEGVGFPGLRLRPCSGSVGEVSWRGHHRLVSVAELDGLVVAAARS